MFGNYNLQKRIYTSAILLLFVLVIGTLGYHHIEGWPLFDGLYMTVITLATIGYGETHVLSSAGRFFTIILIISSIGIVGYSFSTLASFIIEGEFNSLIKGKKMNKQLSSLKDHFILCGAGPTGQAVAQEFYKIEASFVVIDANSEMIENNILKISGNIPYIVGDATTDEILLQAGIERAKGFVTVLGEDKDNVFTVLCARALNPKLRIISRIINENNIEKLKKAGADEIVSPNAIGGMRMASIMLRPNVVSFLDKMLRSSDQSLRFQEYSITEESSIAGKTLKETDIYHNTGLLVVAIKPFDKEGYLFNPDYHTKLEKGDVLIVMGSKKQLDKLEAFAGI